MSGKRYSEEFKREAVRQLTDRGYSICEVSRNLGVSTKSLYDWRSRYLDVQADQRHDHEQELARLKVQLRRVTEERDILKKAAAYFAKASQ